MNKSFSWLFYYQLSTFQYQKNYCWMEFFWENIIESIGQISLDVRTFNNFTEGNPRYYTQFFSIFTRLHHKIFLNQCYPQEFRRSRCSHALGAKIVCLLKFPFHCPGFKAFPHRNKIFYVALHGPCKHLVQFPHRVQALKISTPEFCHANFGFMIPHLVF